MLNCVAGAQPITEGTNNSFANSLLNWRSTWKGTRLCNHMHKTCSKFTLVQFKFAKKISCPQLHNPRFIFSTRFLVHLNFLKQLS